MNDRVIRGKQTVSLLGTVLQIAAPVFLLAAIGYAWVRLGYAYDTAFVTRLAMTLAIPALILTALAGTTVDPAAVGAMALAALTAYAAALAAFWALCRAARLEMRTWLAPLVFGNTGNLGLPLCLFAFGEAGLALGVAVFAVTSIGQFTVGLWLVSGGGSPMPALREPMLGATVLGGVILWQGWTLPPVAANALGLIGQMAIPLMLITLGVAVARLKPDRAGLMAGMAVAKLALGAGLGFAIAWAFGLDRVAAGVLVVQLATPVAVTSYMLALRYEAGGADPQAVAGVVVVSTALSVLALPALLAVLL